MEFDSTRVLLVEDDDDAAEEMAEALSNADILIIAIGEGGLAPDEEARVQGTTGVGAILKRARMALGVSLDEAARAYERLAYARLSEAERRQRRERRRAIRGERALAHHAPAAVHHQRVFRREYPLRAVSRSLANHRGDSGKIGGKVVRGIGL